MAKKNGQATPMQLEKMRPRSSDPLPHDLVDRKADSEQNQLEKLKEAELLLAAEREDRQRQFMLELQELCKKYRCDLVPMFQVKAQ